MQSGLSCSVDLDLGLKLQRGAGKSPGLARGAMVPAGVGPWGVSMLSMVIGGGNWQVRPQGADPPLGSVCKVCSSARRHAEQIWVLVLLKGQAHTLHQPQEATALLSCNKWRFSLNLELFPFKRIPFKKNNNFFFFLWDLSACRRSWACFHVLAVKQYRAAPSDSFSYHSFVSFLL